MEIKEKKFLITGGAGFIGSHLCERLLRAGAEVVILDDFSVGKMVNLKNIKNSIKIIKGNIINTRTIERATKGCDVVVHEAFPYGRAGMGLEEQFIEEGAIGTFNVLKAAVKNNVRKVVFASSVAAYGIPKYLPINENHPIDPFLPYGATKRAGELYCSAFSKLYGLDTVSLRYFYVYGPRYSTLDHSALVNFINRAIHGRPLLIYGDGSQIRDYTYIDDAIDGTILAIKKENTKGAVYNISSGLSISVSGLAQTIKKIMGKDIEIIFAKNNQYRYVPYCRVPVGMTSKKSGRWIDERNYTADLSLSKKELGYKPKIDLETGIRQTAEWLISQKIL